MISIDIDPALSLQEKEKGNEFFKKQQYPESIKCYTEAIKRNPTDHTIYSNRAASYTKLGEYPTAIKDCDEAMHLSPNFVKAYIRKGNCQFFMKEYHKCLETYEKGLKIDPENTELKEGMNKTLFAINAAVYFPLLTKTFSNIFLAASRSGRRRACRKGHARSRNSGHSCRSSHDANPSGNESAKEESAGRK